MVVLHMFLECTCAEITERQHDNLYAGATVANKKVVDKLVKRHLSDLYSYLALELRNPYRYYKTKTHLILIHSATDYFIRIVA